MSHPNPLVESNRVEGTPVFDLHGKRIGTISYLVIEKVSGRVVEAVMTFGGFLGFGSHPYSIPWEKLKFDTTLNGYRIDITQAQLGSSPVASGDEEIWPDHKDEKQSRDDWDVPPFRGV
jgi:sporulation protein YlmC with PRC-barrel domain